MKDLWTPDEPRYALVAQEMLQSGDWVVLHANGEVYREKPPLLFWVIAAVSAPFGAVNEFTARVPSIVAALLTVWLTFDLARRMFGDRAGMWSAIVLATTFRFWWQSHTGQIDMLLTACVTLAVYALWRWHESRRGMWPIVYYAGTALGLLAKGPPTLVFTLSSAIGFLWGRRDIRHRVLLWLGVPLSIVPVALWFYIARRLGTDDVTGEISGTFSRQLTGRILSGVSHPQPPWHYLMQAPVELFPWVLVLPWTIVHTWRTRREGPAVRLLLSWLLPALIFFHIIVEKRAVYLLPLYPPVAILIARSILALIGEGHRAWLRATAIIWVPVTIGVAATPFLIGFTPAAGGAQPIMYLLLVAGLLCLSWTVLLLKAKAWRHWPVALAAQTAVLLFAVGVGAFPVVDFTKSSKDFCEPVRALVSAGDVHVMSVRLVREEKIFYSNAHHEIVLQLPAVSIFGEPGDEPAEERARKIRSKLAAACEDIPVSDWIAPSEKERAALREAINTVLAKSGLSDADVKRYREEVAREVESVVDVMRGETPAVLFSTTDDWRWVLSLAQDTSFLIVLKHEQVSSRKMLLLANPAAMQALQRAGWAESN